MKSIIVPSLLVLALAVPGRAVAQAPTGGTAVFKMKVHVPDATAVSVIGSDIETEMSVATNGKKIAMDVSTGGSGPAAGTHVKMVFEVGGDSMHMAILMPPEVASSTGMPGMRMDIPMSSLGADNPLIGAKIDSIKKTMGKPSYRSLNKTSSVAGLQCAEWEMVAGTDTTDVCVVPTPPMLTEIQSKFKDAPAMKQMMSQMQGIADNEANAFGGKPMTPIRTTNTKTGVAMELVSFHAGAPDASTFELPAGLQSMPVPGKPGGGSFLK